MGKVGCFGRNESFLFSVPEHGERVHANIQPDLHDAAGGPLVRVSAVPGAHAAGVPP